MFWVASNLSNKSFNFVLFLLVFDDVRMTSPVLISQESSSPISTFKKLLMKGGRVVIADLPGFLTVVVVRMTNFLNRLSKRITQVKNYGHFKKSSEGETLSVCRKNRNGRVIFFCIFVKKIRAGRHSITEVLNTCTPVILGCLLSKSYICILPEGLDLLCHNRQSLIHSSVQNYDFLEPLQLLT